MQAFEKLDYRQFYHIYNYGVGGRDLFLDTNNYEYFLDLYDKYISPVAETYARCLMKNHFHLLVRIKEETEVVALFTPNRVQNPERLNLTGLKPQHQHFSNLFNAYTKAFNKYHQTRGALFERPFRRKLIDCDDYLRQVVLYIHNNPVHQSFCEHPIEYPWSSYLTCTSIKPTKQKREAVIEWFDDGTNFKAVHEQQIEREKIERWLELQT